MPDIEKYSGVEMADIEKISGHDVPSGGGGTASTTPTISVSGGTFGSVTVTVTNHSSYTNPNYECVVTVGGTTTVADSAVNHTLDTGDDGLSATMTFSDTNTTTGTRTVTVKAQEFGDNVQSSAATATFDKVNIQNHYIRIRGVTSSGSNTSSPLAIEDIRFFDGSGQSGTEYPTTNLTSSTSETGIVTSTGQTFSSTYADWKAADSSTITMWWALSTSAANNWWQIQFESSTYSTAPEIKSMQIRFDGQTQASFFSIAGSDTGNFSGEETDYGVFSITAENTPLNFG